MKRKLLFAAILIASALGAGPLFAQFDADKVYTIVNRNDANLYVQDNSTGGVSMGSMNDNSYWKFEATANTNCYYVKNVATGKYMQSCKESGVEVNMGDNPVEYSIILCAAEGEGMYGMASTDQTTYDFTAGTIGCNWKNNNTVQGFAAVAGTNHRSFWKIVEVEEISSPYAGNEIAAGDFFLYNVETGLWLQNNEKNTGDWNTRGATGTYGFEFGVSAIDGGWKLDPKFGNNHSMNSLNFYLDTSREVTAWTFEPKTVNGVTNTYTIKADGKVLGLDNNDNLALGNSNNSTWQLVTRAQRLAYLEANATEDNPLDATFLIMDPSFANNNERASAWVWNQNGGNLDDIRSLNNRRSYAVWNSTSFTISQNITNIIDGKYKLTFKGYYRDGGNDVYKRRANGTERLLAQYFINNDKANVMSILDGAFAAKPSASDLGNWGPGNWAGNDTYGYYPDEAGAFNRVFHFYPDKYVNAGIISTVTGGSMTIGLEKTTANASDWLAFDDFRLTYLGPIDISEYTDALNTVIQAAEAFTGNTTTVLQEALNTALSEARDVVNSTDTDVLSAKTGALNSALAAAQSVDITLLAATIPFAEADGVDVASANDVLSNGTTASQVNDALSALRLARRIANAETQADVFAGNAPAAGDYYLYNVGTGRFFCGGDDWGAHAALGFPGIIVTLEGDGSYKIDTHLKNGDALHYLNYGGYCDTETNDTWTFNEVSTDTDVYNIVRTSDNNLMLGYSTNTYNRLDTDKSGADNPNNQWKLVTKADRDALLATATKEAPQDASYLIKSPNFSQREDVSAWTLTGDASIWERGKNHPDFAIEAYNKTAAGVEQTVSGLPAGTYELKVQAFYRDGNFAKQANILANGGEARQLATLYAGTKSALIQNVSGGADKAPGMGRASTIGYMPDGIDDACLYFQSGLYWATLDEIVVGQDGTMTIGARKTEKLNDGDWMVLDNFRLIYKGAGIDLTGVKADLAAKISEANDLLNNIGLELSYLKTAATTGQDVYNNSTDADEIVNATNALQTAINATQNVNFTVFNQTVVLANAENVTTTTAVDAVKAADANNIAGVVSAQINNLRTARKMNALAMPDIYTGAAPEAGKVYLFNVGTRLFLGAGSDWNTHAAVDQVGIEVELVAAEGGFTMKCAWGSFNNSPYVDTGANTVYTFQSVAGKENVYNILEGSDLLGWNPNGKTDGKKYWNSISNVSGADAADANYQWKVITPAERKALLAQASDTNPVDVSYLINNPSHNRKAGYDMYTKVTPDGKGGARVSSQDDGDGNRAADFGYEFFNVDNLEWSQQLTGLTPGKYEVAVQGYYREGDGGYQTGVVNNGGTLLRKAYLKANDEKAELQNIAYCLDGVPGVGTAESNNGTFPNWPREAFEYFETGYYWTSVQVTVGNDGQLKIGVYKDNKTDNDWIVLDNFRLRLLEADKASANMKITDAEYATFIAPFDVEIPDGVTASTATINEMDDTKLDLTPLDDVIPAHTPVILYSDETLNQNFVGILVAEPDNLKTGVLTGTYEEIDAPVGSYVLQNQAGNVGFFLVEGSDKPKVSANRAYLTVENSNLVKAFILGESDADGIRSLDNEFLGKNNGAIFNLAGQRMTKTQRGVNIVNKKKVVIK